MDDSSSDDSSLTRSSSVTRRRLLRAGTGITAVSMAGGAGCIGDFQSPDGSEEFDDYPPPDEFEKCSTAAAVNIDWLPDPARIEVETALEDGQYETDEELYLSHLIDTDTVSLIPETWDYDQAGIAYRALVTQDGTTTTLELEEAVPSHGEEPFNIENMTDEQLTVEIQVTRNRTDETVLDETVTVEPESDTETAPFDRPFGEYQLTATTDRNIEDELSHSWTEKNDQHPQNRIDISTDSVGIRPRVHIHPWECAEWAE